MLYFKKYLCILTVLLCILPLAACKADGGQQPSGEELQIVTSFYPMYVFTKNITEGITGVSVHNMTKPQTGCLHDYQLLPEDLKTLNRAEIFVINGAGMESFMDKVLESLPGLDVIEASEGIPLLPSEENEVRSDAHSHLHEEGVYNSHVWLSPPYAAKEIQNIAKGLAQADPVHAEQYRGNADAYAEKILNIWEEVKPELAAYRGEAIIISHEAFDYLAQELEISVVGTVRSEESTEPSAKTISELITIAREKRIKGIFAEPQYPQTALKTISNETEIPIYTLDPMVTGEQEYQNVYENLLRQNVETLKRAFSDKGTDESEVTVRE